MVICFMFVVGKNKDTSCYIADRAPALLCVCGSAAGIVTLYPHVKSHCCFELTMAWAGSRDQIGLPSCRQLFCDTVDAAVL